MPERLTVAPALLLKPVPVALFNSNGLSIFTAKKIKP
jgi:hypothetical protein